MKLDTLYKRTKTSAIQFWKIEVIEASPANYGWGIVKTSGQLGTDKPIVHRETITQGKNIGRSNETTPQQQAESQAKSDWQKKHDEGYKSLADLKAIIVQADDNASDDVKQMSDENLEKCLQQWLPTFNTDAAGNVKPMLATDWNKVKNIIYPCYIQPKLDGVRCLMINKQGEIIFLSRSGKEYTTLSHIRSDIYNTTIADLPVDFILDGEIYSDELSFQQIIEAVKKQRPESLKLKFRAYDIVTETKQEERLLETLALVQNINSLLVTMVETHKIHYKEDVKACHDNWVQEGYEGAMLRLFNGKYAQGQRSRDLLKVKEFDETEFAFLQFEFGQRIEDLIAVCIIENGTEFRAKMIGSKAEKERLYKEHKDKASEGKSFTVKHFGYTDDGLPRFPIGKGFRNYE